MYMRVTQMQVLINLKTDSISVFGATQIMWKDNHVGASTRYLISIYVTRF